MKRGVPDLDEDSEDDCPIDGVREGGRPDVTGSEELDSLPDRILGMVFDFSGADLERGGLGVVVGNVGGRKKNGCTGFEFIGVAVGAEVNLA